MEASNTYTITLTHCELLNVAFALFRDSYNEWSTDEARKEAFRLSTYFMTRLPDGLREQVMLEM